MIRIETDVDYGKEYEDEITGFRGKCTGVTRHQFGCIRICLTPKTDKDGELGDEKWFNESNLIDGNLSQNNGLGFKP